MTKHLVSDAISLHMAALAVGSASVPDQFASVVSLDNPLRAGAREGERAEEASGGPAGSGSEGTFVPSVSSAGLVRRGDFQDRSSPASAQPTSATALRREEHALEVLLSLTERLAENVSLEVALRALTDAALELVPGDHSSVRLLNESRTELLSGARSGTGTKSPPPFRRGQGVVGWVVEHGEVAYVRDTAKDSRFERHPEHDFEAKAVIAVPLWASGQVVGVLSISAPSVDAFDPRDVLLSRLLANCASPAFEKARLERLALTDPNTKSFNRRYLMPRLEQEVALCRGRRRTFSILMMDLDHFKKVNDVYGHAVGDDVLAEFAERVRMATRKVDELVRWGGEEFVLVMPGADHEDAAIIAERVRAQVSEAPFHVGTSRCLRQTVSLGVATWRDGETPGALERRADQAMYEAKHGGRDRVVVAD